jgi:hypothetical protein
VFKPRRVIWALHVARIGERRRAYRILVGRLEGRRRHGRHRHRFEGNIEMAVQRAGRGKDWIDVARDRERWLAVTNSTVKLQVA